MINMNRFLFLFSLVIGMVFTCGTVSCTQQTPTERVVHSETTEEAEDLSDNVIDEEKEQTQEKPARSEGFYERLLETFCQNYYKDCFAHCSYKSNSLRITDIDIVRNEIGLETAYAMGVHSAGGLRGHKDIYFTATITEKENDYFKVFFCKDKYVLGKKKDQEAGTRMMEYTEH